MNPWIILDQHEVKLEINNNRQKTYKLMGPEMLPTEWSLGQEIN